MHGLTRRQVRHLVKCYTISSKGARNSSYNVQASSALALSFSPHVSDRHPLAMRSPFHMFHLGFARMFYAFRPLALLPLLLDL